MQSIFQPRQHNNKHQVKPVFILLWAQISFIYTYKKQWDVVLIIIVSLFIFHLSTWRDGENPVITWKSVILRGDYYLRFRATLKQIIRAKIKLHSTLSPRARRTQNPTRHSHSCTSYCPTSPSAASYPDRYIIMLGTKVNRLSLYWVLIQRYRNHRSSTLQCTILQKAQYLVLHA